MGGAATRPPLWRNAKAGTGPALRKGCVTCPQGRVPLEVRRLRGATRTVYRMARPILIVNPRSDTDFVAFANEHVEADADTAAVLEERLRPRYPRVVVRERDLFGEAPTWYVYREGTWTPSDR